MPSSSDIHVSTKKFREKDTGKRRRSKTDRRARSKRSKKKLESYSRSSSSSRRHAPKSARRMSLATYKAQLPPMSSDDQKMNELCRQLGLEGGEYRDGYYVRYIEVPTETKKPKVVYEDQITYVDVPEIEYITKEVDDVRVEEVVKHVPKIQRVEVPKENVKYVPKIKTRHRKVKVPVPGKLVDNPIHYELPNMVIKPTFHDQEQDVIVAQVLKPHINVHKGPSKEIEAYTIDPVMYPVDIYVPFPVQSTLRLTHMTPTEHHKVEVPEAHYNSLVNKLNETVPDDYRTALFKTKKGKKGRSYIPLLPPGEDIQVTHPHHGGALW